MSDSCATRIAIGMPSPRDACGKPAAVEPLEGETQGLLNIGAQTHPLGQQRRGSAVRVDQS